MFEGNRFFPETGMPMRKIACMSSPLALAEPVPLTFASLNAKSFTRLRPIAARGLSCQWIDEFELLHVPGGRRTTFRAQTAVDTKIFVLRHDARGLRQRIGHDTGPGPD